MKRFLVLILLIALALAATEKKSDEKVAEKRKYYNDGPDWFFRKAVANFFRAFDYLSRVVRHRRGGPNREVRKIGAGRIGGPSKKGGFGGQQQRPPQSQQRPPQGEQQQGEQGEQQQGPGVQTLQGSQQRPPQQQGPSGQQTLQGTQQRPPQQGAGIFGNRPPGGSLFGGSGERYGEEEGHDQQAEDAFKRGIDLILAVINSQGISKKRSVGRTVREPKNFNHNNQDADLQEEREGFLPAFYVGYDFVVQYLTQALRDNPEWFDVEEFGWEFLQAWDVILDDYFTGGFGGPSGPGPIVPAGPAGNSGFRPGPGGNSGFRPGPGGNSGFRPGPGGRKEEEPEEKK